MRDCPYTYTGTPTTWQHIFLPFLTAFLTALLLAAAAAPASGQASPLVKLIEITGNKRISTGTIESKMETAQGSPFSKSSVQRDIRKLYGLGYFDDIQVAIDSFEGGVKLIYTFIEKPTIISIDFQGNDEFDKDKLDETITLTPGAMANLALINDNAAKLVQFYQSEGYWLTKVVPILNEVSEGSVALTYEIVEGPEVSIDEITFEGNEAIDDDDILDVMQTGEWSIFSIFTNKGVYREDLIRDDIIRIKALYQSRGYLYIAVSEPVLTLSDDQEDLFLSFSVSEGDQYSVSKLSIKGNTVFSAEALLKTVKTSPDAVFNRIALGQDIDRIIDMYMNEGYARADINPDIDVNRENRTADITLQIREGQIFRVGRVNIHGNTKTRDKVIRREVRLDEGSIFRKNLLKRSYQRINNLNFFESVDIKETPRTEEPLMDLNIDVREKMTGMLSLGGGYGSVDKFMVMGEITQANLFGRGLYLKFKADLSSRRTNFNISLRDPWFLDKPISASIGGYNEVFDYLDYDKQATGGFIGFGKELSEYVKGNIQYKIEEVEITEINEDASSLIRDQEGKRVTSSIHPSISRDTRDNYIDPSEGSRNSLSGTVAGLGGDNFFYKGLVDSLWYFPLFWDTTFSIRGRYGYAEGYNGEEVPVYERFYVGGINTIRGLGFGEGGPENDEGEKIGGLQEVLVNLEYIFPIYKDLKLKGVVFFDYGGAFDEDEDLAMTFSNMRMTAGAGVRWLSPFGPIRLEWGYNLEPKGDEEDSKLEFSMGGIF